MGLAGCTASKVEQRNGCWVRQVRTFPSSVKEDVGPCSRPTPVWSEDRLTRLVQECVMHADYQWQSSAMVAWNRGEPLPEREPEEKMLSACMARAEAVLRTEKGDVEQRLSEVTKERDSLKASQEKDRAEYQASLSRERDQREASLNKVREQHDASMERAQVQHDATVGRALDQMHDSNNRLTEVLGEAAKKPAPSAIATATSTSTSEGKANTQSDSNTRSDSRSRGDSTSRGDATSRRNSSSKSRGPTVAKPTSGTPLPTCSAPTAARQVQANTSKPVLMSTYDAEDTTACRPAEPSGDTKPTVQAVLAQPTPQAVKAPAPLEPDIEQPGTSE
ncbi:hypothetical protein JY651_37710 [Pyxidicoccus parkwayensis]|uniref:Lipoprotein n=2 Tax=Pyxidicoccus parkwayensis TaxID=2813578 RepID=A0ABX7PD70_9BACT|nr:hypothetical protein JY651_37710 [Pyxidicoccus parkwaysis]